MKPIYTNKDRTESVRFFIINETEGFTTFNFATLHTRIHPDGSREPIEHRRWLSETAVKRYIERTLDLNFGLTLADRLSQS